MIKNINLFRGKPKLIEPYKLSFGVLHYFDTLLLVIEDDRGCQGVGEATFLPGYSTETCDEGECRALQIAQEIFGCDIDESRSVVNQNTSGMPFLRTLFSSAFYTLANPVSRSFSFPLTAWVDISSESRTAAHVRQVLASGYKTIKVKAGVYSEDREIQSIRRVMDLAAGKAMVRVDANGGLAKENAASFINALAHPCLEWMEQPLPVTQWDETQNLITQVSVPIILDESIVSMDTIEKAADIGAAGVKLKLVKAGAAERFQNWIKTVLAKDLKLCVGNGVQTDPGCLLEAFLCAQAGHCMAGEMNGWLKLKHPVFKGRLCFANGNLVYDHCESHNFDMNDLSDEWRLIFRREI